jgi:hypothetical protein
MLVLASLNAAGANSAASADKSGQITIRLVKLPANTPRNATIYLAGDFNGWNASDDRYRLTPDFQGQYGITLPATVGALSKFTLTLKEEPDPAVSGADSLSRPYLIMESEAGTIYLAVQSWSNKEVRVTRGSYSPTMFKRVFSHGGLFENNVVPFIALGLVFIIPGIIYIGHLKHREQVLRSVIEETSLAEYQAKGKDLSEAIAALQSNSKELERWSRVVER